MRAPTVPAPRVTGVMLTYRCATRVPRMLPRIRAMGIPVIAVDNGSDDGTVEALQSAAWLDVIALPKNIGAAARNLGVLRAQTPYVAFCDDDTWWESDGLRRAADVLDRHAGLAVVNARIMVEPDGALDPISAEMAASPLPADDLPGTVIMSFMAGAVVIRRSAYLAAGGYHPRFFMGGEEETLAWPLAGAGWEMRYLDEVVVHHEPSLANVVALRSHGIRNTIWNSWLHRPKRVAASWTWYVIRGARKDRVLARALLGAIVGIGWVASRRRRLPPAVEARVAMLDPGRRGSPSRQYGTPRRSAEALTLR